MSAITDWVTAIFTVVLAVATFVLALNTAQLTKASREIAINSERNRIKPILKFESASWISPGEGDHVKVAIKNVGYGAAKNPIFTAKGPKGDFLAAPAVTPGTVMEVNAPFYWDVLGVVPGDKIEIGVEFRNSNDELQERFVYTLTVEGSTFRQLP